MKIGIIVVALLLIIGVFLIVTYNNLVRLRQRVQNAWSQVDVQLKRRYDLIPNLINTVKGYARHCLFQNIDAHLRWILDDFWGCDRPCSTVI